MTAFGSRLQGKSHHLRLWARLPALICHVCGRGPPGCACAVLTWGWDREDSCVRGGVPSASLQLAELFGKH